LAAERIDPSSLQVNYHDLVMQSPDSIVLIDTADLRIIDANPRALDLFGRSMDELLGKTLADFTPPHQPDGRPSRQLFENAIQRVLQSEFRIFEACFAHSDGNIAQCEMRLVLVPVPGRQLAHARIVDVTRRNLNEQLRVGQTKLLEMVARSAPLKQTLESLTRLIEGQSPGVLCSVLLLDPDGVTIRNGAGPSLPEEYMALLDGFPIGPETGSCGTAMYTRKTVIVTDIMEDPLWAPYTQLAAPHGLRACWSMPIMLDGDHVMGTFAMYYKEVRAPTDDDMRLIGVATYLAGIAIERTRREHELAQHREHLEELVAARSAELTMAQDELARRDKLAALGTLVAGIAHELNTPIGNGLTTATTMADHVCELEQGMATGLRRSTLETYIRETKEASNMLARNLQRAADLVYSFKQIAVQQSSSERSLFSVTRLLTELLPPLRAAVHTRPLKVHLDCQPDAWMDSYPGSLTQVIFSLFENCLQHAFEPEARGNITLRFSRDGDHATLSITDDGKGITSEDLPRIFDPFFTTCLGAGSGLGLHVAHNIVTGILGGRVDVSSKSGQGTTFTLHLPSTAPALNKTT
jgi:PAS domain S-box-containing protein